MSSVTLYADQIDDSSISRISDYVAYGFTNLGLSIMDQTDDEIMTTKFIDIINNSNITSLSLLCEMMFSDDDLSCYYHILAKIISKNKLKSIYFKNYKINGVDSLPILAIINHSSVQKLYVAFDLTEQEYEVLKNNTKLIAFLSVHNNHRLTKHYYNDKIYKLVHANKTRINKIETICIAILGSHFAYRDLRALVAKYIWNARYE